MSNAYRPRQKKSLYVTADMVEELERESARLDRSESWLIQLAWKIALAKIKAMPSLEVV